MRSGLPCVLTINAGSSSIRFAIYEMSDMLQLRLAGGIDRIGSRGTRLFAGDASQSAPTMRALPVRARGHRAAAHFLLEWLATQPLFASVAAVGHRVVHGMRHARPERIGAALLAELHRITPYAPAHLPQEIGLIEALRRRHPQLPQVACFDTAFHRSMPVVAKLLPIPRRYALHGVERYGFHGLSYQYLMEELVRIDPAARRGRVILAHLGNGASLAAVRDGAGIDTSMGFTPAGGLVMSTRSGDLDPGLMFYLARSAGLSATQMQRMLNSESGLRGVSGSSADVRDLLAREASDARAAEALALFCYQTKKWIGSFAAALGGLDTLVFAGGIGENAAAIRTRICNGLGFLGLQLNARRNAKNATLISTDASRIKVRVIRTDEQLMIARSVFRILKPGPHK
jgi:acetate kinase